MEQKTEILVNYINEGIYGDHAIKIDSNTDEQLYGSFLSKLFMTYRATSHDHLNTFSEMFDELGIDYTCVKLCEKINIIKSLHNQSNMTKNDELEKVLLDTAGYAILTLVELEKRKQ